MPTDLELEGRLRVGLRELADAPAIEAVRPAQSVVVARTRAHRRSLVPAVAGGT